jgi:hypothetical protein
MANYKITTHIMPHEIDYFMLMAIQLKKSKYYLPATDNISIYAVLNLSDYLINWNHSRLPKEFFKEKFESLAPLLEDYNFKLKIYEESELYGCLDVVRETVESHIDYYINICPDMYFSEHLLFYMLEASKQVKNKYFVLTPEIPKMWDQTWDEITNKNYMNIPYNEWNNQDIFDIRKNLKDNVEEVKIRPTTRSKWAGWFDCYNKAYWEELLPILPEWKGYGPHDLYSLILSEHAKKIGYDFQQWVIENQIIFQYDVGSLREKGFSKYYKELISYNSIPDQRKEFEKNLPFYLDKWIKEHKK